MIVSPLRLITLTVTFAPAWAAVEATAHNRSAVALTYRIEVLWFLMGGCLSGDAEPSQ